MKRERVENARGARCGAAVRKYRASINKRMQNNTNKEINVEIKKEKRQRQSASSLEEHYTETFSTLLYNIYPFFKMLKYFFNRDIRFEKLVESKSQRNMLSRTLCWTIFSWSCHRHSALISEIFAIKYFLYSTRCKNITSRKCFVVCSSQFYYSNSDLTIHCHFVILYSFIWCLIWLFVSRVNIIVRLLRLLLYLSFDIVV